MKFFKTLTAAIIPVIVLTACSLFSSVLSFDASGYAKACLDATLKQNFTEYAKLTGQTEEEAKAEFEKEDIFGDAVGYEYHVLIVSGRHSVLGNDGPGIPAQI